MSTTIKHLLGSSGGMQNLVIPDVDAAHAGRLASSGGKEDQVSGLTQWPFWAHLFPFGLNCSRDDRGSSMSNLEKVVPHQSSKKAKALFCFNFLGSDNRFRSAGIPLARDAVVSEGFPHRLKGMKLEKTGQSGSRLLKVLVAGLVSFLTAALFERGMVRICPAFILLVLRLLADFIDSGEVPENAFGIFM